MARPSETCGAELRAAGHQFGSARFWKASVFFFLQWGEVKSVFINVNYGVINCQINVPSLSCATNTSASSTGPR